MGDFDAFDTIVPLTAAKAAALRAAGVVMVSRYLAHSSSIGKIIHLAEAQVIRAAGLRLVLNWEQQADTLLTASASTIIGWAHEAALAALACGAPAGDVIPVSIDFDVSPAQWVATVGPNLARFDQQLRPYGLRVTGYGSGYACRRMVEQGYPPPWQAMSTGWRESSTNAAGIAVRQLRNQTVAGISGDVSKIILPNSWAGTPSPSGGTTVATTDQIITAIANGSSSTPDGHPVSPVLWQVANEKRFADLAAQLRGQNLILMELAAKEPTPAPAPGGPDPAVLAGVASALNSVADQLRVLAGGLAGQPSPTA